MPGRHKLDSDPGGGGVAVATIGTNTEVTNAVANGVVLAANADRKGSSIFNDDTYGTGAVAHIALGFAASATVFTVKLLSGVMRD